VADGPLRHERDSLVAEQRHLRTKELAVPRVLDERGQIDPTLDADVDNANRSVSHQRAPARTRRDEASGLPTTR